MEYTTRLDSGNRLVIAIDCDEVIVETVGPILRHYNKQYGADLPAPLEPKHYYNGTPYDWGVANDPQEGARRVEAYTQSDEFAALVPEETAVAAIRRLAAQHSIHIVTGRREDQLATITQQMVDTYLPGCIDGIHYTSYFNEQQRQDKSVICERIGANVLIDDHAKHLNTILAMNDECPAPAMRRIVHTILFGEYPWQPRPDERDSRIISCPTWPAVERTIAQIAQDDEVQQR